MGLPRMHSFCCQIVSDPESDSITTCQMSVSLNLVPPVLAARRQPKKIAHRLLRQIKETLFWGLSALYIVPNFIVYQVSR